MFFQTKTTFQPTKQYFEESMQDRPQYDEDDDEMEYEPADINEEIKEESFNQ